MEEQQDFGTLCIKLWKHTQGRTDLTAVCSLVLNVKERRYRAEGKKRITSSR